MKEPEDRKDFTDKINWEELDDMEYASHVANEITELNRVLRKIQDDNQISSEIMESFTQLTMDISEPRERLEKKIELANTYIDIGHLVGP